MPSSVPAPYIQETGIFVTRTILIITGWFTRTFPRCRGRWRLIQWLSRRKQWLAALDWQQIKVRDVGDMKVLPSEFIGRYLFFYGEYEGEVVHLFKHLLSPGDSAVDVGANIGLFTLLASRLCGPKGRVYSFEASPEVLGILKHNVRINHASNIVLHECAVGNGDGVVRFHLAESRNMGLGSMRSLGGSRDRSVTVPVGRLDMLVPQSTRIKLLKVDVEGAEPMVLKGARGIIERDLPFIVLELTDAYSRQLNCCAAEALSLLWEFGYSLHNIGDSYREILDPPTDQVNLLCVPPGRQSMLSALTPACGSRPAK